MPRAFGAATRSSSQGRCSIPALRSVRSRRTSCAVCRCRLSRRVSTTASPPRPRLRCVPRRRPWARYRRPERRCLPEPDAARACRRRAGARRAPGADPRAAATQRRRDLVRPGGGRSGAPVRGVTVAPAAGSETLLERGEIISVLDEMLAGVRSSSAGRLVLLGGEAGVGKTALLRRFCELQDRGVRVLWGACEPLRTPCPLSPLLDIAQATGGELHELVAEGARPHEVTAALLRELRGRLPTVLVLEDVHWADEATLDVMTLLARRIGAAPVLVLASYRDDELDGAGQLRHLLGELVRRPGRLKLEPLSRAAVAELARPHAVDAEELHRGTGGNPFFVVEVLAASGERIPETVRDAVLARAGRLSEPARRLLDAVAIVPGDVELWLLEALGGGLVDRVDECLASGMLRAGRAHVAFRHELARQAIEDAVSPNRRVALHRAALGALAARDADVARSPITRTPPATPTACCDGRRRPPSARRVRRPSRGRCAVRTRAPVCGRAAARDSRRAAARPRRGVPSERPVRRGAGRPARGARVSPPARRSARRGRCASVAVTTAVLYGPYAGGRADRAACRRAARAAARWARAGDGVRQCVAAADGRRGPRGRHGVGHAGARAWTATERQRGGRVRAHEHGGGGARRRPAWSAGEARAGACAREAGMAWRTMSGVRTRCSSCVA